MKSNLIYKLLAVAMIASMFLAACAPQATATQAPAAPATQAPPVVQPTAAPAFEAKYNLSAPDCSYGGEMKSIEAVDQYTVKFTLCTPDPAFLSKVAFPAFGLQSAAHLQATGGGGGELLNNPLGTGPYMVKEWAKRTTWVSSFTSVASVSRVPR